METILGGNRFSKLENHAYWANVNLDTRFHVDKDSVDYNHKQIQDCINHPTTGLLAAKKYKTYNYIHCYERNYKELLTIPLIKNATDYFESKFQKLYPKTGKARKFLINNNNIVLNYVKPIKKSLKRTVFKWFGV